jgi:hypothetical protein
MTETVWVSDAPMDTTLIKRVEADVTLSNVERAIEISKLTHKGNNIPADWLPKKIYARTKKINSLPHLFFANVCWCVSEKSAEVLSKFDLGVGGLTPVSFFQPDHKTPIEGDHYILNFGTKKNAFSRENSPATRVSSMLVPGEVPKDWGLPYEMADGLVSVSQAALEGPDIWFDPKLRSAFFVSDRLGKALAKAKLIDPFRLYLCNVI